VNKKRLALLKTNFLYICMPIARYPYTYACGCLLLGLIRRPKELQRNFSQMKIPWMTMVMVLLLLQSLGTSLLLFMALCLCFLATLCFSTVAAPENIIFRQKKILLVFSYLHGVCQLQ